MTKSTHRLMVGFDCGNGYAKSVFSDGRKPIIFPSTAATVSNVADSFDGHKQSPLIVSGSEWYAGFDSGQAKGEPRVYKGVALSDDHHAVFLEFLDRTGQDIHTLVVGLPADQIRDKDMQESLRKRLVKTHNVRGRSLKVGRVGIFDQPRGSARHYIETMKNRVDQTFLVIDIGYGTTDVTLVRASVDSNGTLHVGADRDSTHAYWLAASQICEKVSADLAAQTGCARKPSKISQMLRDGAHSVILGGKSHNIMPLIKKATNATVKELSENIRGKFRTLDGIDLILLTGGGANIAAAAMKSEFSEKHVETIKRPELANANGFLLMAQSHG